MTRAKDISKILTDADISGTLDATGIVTANAGIKVDNITIDGTEIDLSSGDLTLDVANDIILDADGGNWRFKDAGTSILDLSRDSNTSIAFYSAVSNMNMLFKGNDGGSTITALTLDIADAGTALFNHDIKMPNAGNIYFLASSGYSPIISNSGDTNSLSVFTNNNERMRINSTGNVGINSSNPSAKLTVEGTLSVRTSSSQAFNDSNNANNLTMNDSKAHFNVDGADKDFQVSSDSNANMLVVDAGQNNVGIGTSPVSTRILHVQSNTAAYFNTMIDHASSSNNVYGLDIFFSGQSPDNTSSEFLRCRDTGQVRCKILSNGNVLNANDVYGAISDEKLKEQIKDASSQWNDIKELKIRKYKFKTDVAKGDSDAHWRLGVIAQELETSGMNGLVMDSPDIIENEDGEIVDLGTTTKSVKSSVLHMKAVKALQEAMARIETLEAKVTTLEGA